MEYQSLRLCAQGWLKKNKTFLRSHYFPQVLQLLLVREIIVCIKEMLISCIVSIVCQLCGKLVFLCHGLVTDFLYILQIEEQTVVKESFLCRLKSKKSVRNCFFLIANDILQSKGTLQERLIPELWEVNDTKWGGGGKVLGLEECHY